MHYEKYMVGARPANYNSPLWKRYFRLSKHQQPGRIKKAVLGLMLALEMKAGVFACG